MTKYLLFILIILFVGCKSGNQKDNNDAGFSDTNTNTNLDAGTDGGVNANKDNGERSQDAGITSLATGMHKATQIKTN